MCRGLGDSAAESSVPMPLRVWLVWWHTVVFAAVGAGVAAILGHDCQLRVAVVAVEREVELGVGTAQILAGGHHDQLHSAPGTSRRDAVVHEVGLLGDSLSVL